AEPLYELGHGTVWKLRIHDDEIDPAGGDALQGLGGRRAPPDLVHSTDDAERPLGTIRARHAVYQHCHVSASQDPADAIVPSRPAFNPRRTRPRHTSNSDAISTRLA